MQKEIFKNLVNVLDKEIELYTEMRNLYTKKREILIKNDITGLTEIDTKIIENYESIKKIDIFRVDATKLIGEDVSNMTKLIEAAEEKCPKYVNKLREQQTKLNSLSSAISVLNMTNMNLVKHGMLLADKRLNIIIEACAPKGTSYSDKGVEKVQNMEMSTIVTEV